MRKIFPWDSKPVAIISKGTVINSINADSTVLNVNTKSQYDASSDEFNLCCLGRQVQLPAHAKPAVLLRCQGAGIMTIETHGHVVEHWYSMNARGLMDSLRGMPFFIYIANIKDKQVNLPKVRMVPYASSAPACITHANDVDLLMLANKGLNLTQSNKQNPNPTVLAVQYRPPDLCNKQLNRHNAVKQSDKTLKPTGAKTLPYHMHVLHVATNILTCL